MSNDIDAFLNEFVSGMAEPNEPAAAPAAPPVQAPAVPDQAPAEAAPVAPQAPAAPDPRDAQIAQLTQQMNEMRQMMTQARPQTPAVPVEAMTPEQRRAKFNEEFYADPAAAMEKYVNPYIEQRVAPLQEQSVQQHLQTYMNTWQQNEPLSGQAMGEFTNLMRDKQTQAGLARMPANERQAAFEYMADVAIGRSYRNAVNKGISENRFQVTKPPTYSSGLTAVRPAAKTSPNGLSEIEQSAYDDFVRGGMSPEDALQAAKD